MNDVIARREVKITLRFDEWCLVISILNDVIERSIPIAARDVMIQTERLAHIRETLDRATDL